jgi:sec-independent protein translocase protein TatC
MALGLFNKSKLNPNELSFWGHIDALRAHLMRIVVVVLIIATILFCYPDFLFDTVIFGPIQSDFLTYRVFCKLSHMLDLGNQLCFGHYTFKLQSLGLADQFTNQMWIAFIGGVILGAPYILFELFRFIRPALTEREKSASVAFIIVSTLLFLIGISFSYFVVVPLSINFLGDYKVSAMIENNFTMDSYISFVTTLTFAAGLVFELPILVYFLTKFGLVTPEFMRKYRKHALVIILVVAGIITPSPDVTSQLLVAFPLYLLYEASIFVSSYVIKNQTNYSS